MQILFMFFSSVKYIGEYEYGNILYHSTSSAFTELWNMVEKYAVEKN